MNKKFRNVVAIAGALAALAFPAAAPAQQSGQDAYSPQGQIEQDVEGNQGGVGGSPGAGGDSGGGTAGATANSGSGLPFTGVDVALLAGVGALLLGTGVAVMRVAQRHDTA